MQSVGIADDQQQKGREGIEANVQLDPLRHSQPLITSFSYKKRYI
jgi:hypothetical protein